MKILGPFMTLTGILMSLTTAFQFFVWWTIKTDDPTDKHNNEFGPLFFIFMILVGFSLFYYGRKITRTKPKL